MNEWKTLNWPGVLNGIIYARRCVQIQSGKPWSALHRNIQRVLMTTQIGKLCWTGWKHRKQIKSTNRFMYTNYECTPHLQGFSYYERGCVQIRTTPHSWIAWSMTMTMSMLVTEYFIHSQTIMQTWKLFWLGWSDRWFSSQTCQIRTLKICPFVLLLDTKGILNICGSFNLWSPRHFKIFSP
jgi:hypothetical protein